MTLFEQAALLMLEVFEYNRGNFQYDRKQRQNMEYELAGMRIEQVALWRRDVRDFCTLTPRKMEIYLLVIALELGFCVMALCKARVAPGAPPWLVACHTLAVISALMYLFLALWFGMHAFVSSQAYKVRILTQLVRLPVPTWRSLEAARTYGSAFEKLPGSQMLRVPFATRAHELHPQRVNAHDLQIQGYSAEDKTSADPWGLERRGDKISELAPNVNSTEVERQRHIWLVREAAKFFQTYDAFCRISMSEGTSCLATFFCYHCMTYVMAENAAPVGAWAGMIVFISCALWLIRNDLMLAGGEYVAQFFLVLASPVLSFTITYHTGRNEGHPGPFKYLIAITMFLHGFSLLHCLMLFRVREMQTGAVLPTAFRKVLFIDPFGWAKHSGTWWRHYSQLMITRRGSMLMRLRSMSNLSLSSFSDAGNDDHPTQPTMLCVNTQTPKRPEDVEPESNPTSRTGTNLGGQTQEVDGNLMNVSFRPGTFSRTEPDSAEPSAGGLKGNVQTGTDIHGEKPGLVPWRVYFVVTIFLALCWWLAAGIALYRAVRGKGYFGAYKTATYGKFQPGQVMPIPELFGERVETGWESPLMQPQGLACDANGRIFATVGRGMDGSRGVLHGWLNSEGFGAPSVRFASAPACSEAKVGRGPFQDMTLMGCTSKGNCSAVILVKQGEHLVSCPLHAEGNNALALTELIPNATPLGRAWLHDRGGELLDTESEEAEEGLLQPEEISAVSTVPCLSGHSFRDGHECVAVGTTGRRVAQLGLASVGGERVAWMPRRLLRNDHGDVVAPGMLALHNKRYLAALDRQSSQVHLLDTLQGGNLASTWRLPTLPAGSQWASICGADGTLFALQDGESPALWRFKPKGLDAETSDGSMVFTSQSDSVQI